MKCDLRKVGFAASLTLAAVFTVVLAAQSAQAADRKVMMENFTATW
ncbi:MAG: hypothetical protein JSV91_02625 [Phycisphaerales bacterium]|nr:MAG: hypothetical protein JSV91_02625 [Phycisphaerales bacterium]